MDFIIILPLSTVAIAYAFIIIFGLMGFSALGTELAAFLDGHFLQILIIFFAVILIMAIILCIAAFGGTNPIVAILVSVNTLIASVISFPTFYMFFLEFCASYGVSGVFQTLLCLVEGLVGITIAFFIMIGYFGIFWGLSWWISETNLNVVFKIILELLLVAVNITIVIFYYKLSLSILVDYYINDDAMEVYQNNFSSNVYKFMDFCNGLYIKMSN